MDHNDLYDSEIAAIGPVWKEINQEFMGRTLSTKVLDELKLRTHDRFLKIGLIARVDIPTYVVEGGDGEPVYGQPVLEIVGRIPDSSLVVKEGDHQLLDHELKRAEILKSKETGEKFLGQKGERGL